MQIKMMMCCCLSYAFWGLFMCVSYKCEIIIEFVCAIILKEGWRCIWHEDLSEVNLHNLCEILTHTLSNTSDFNNNTQFLHFSIIIEACQVDTLINRNVMHILYFIITSFAYVWKWYLCFLYICYMLLLLLHILTHLSPPSLSISRKFCVNIKWNFIHMQLQMIFIVSFLTFILTLFLLHSPFSFRKWNWVQFNRFWNIPYIFYTRTLFRQSINL